jgi:hypothetical protein
MHQSPQTLLPAFSHLSETPSREPRLPQAEQIEEGHTERYRCPGELKVVERAGMISQLFPLIAFSVVLARAELNPLASSFKGQAVTVSG